MIDIITIFIIFSIALSPMLWMAGEIGKMRARISELDQEVRRLKNMFDVV